jgi:hypothetical protein
MRKFSRKALVAGGLVATLALGGIAYAYFTTSGAGEGSATVGDSSALVLYGTAAEAVYPGTSSDVSFTVDNSSSGHQLLDTIHLDSVTTDAVGCDTDDFTMDDVVAGEDFASGNGQTVAAHGTLEMANTAVSQDACKNADLVLHLSSN